MLRLRQVDKALANLFASGIFRLREKSSVWYGRPHATVGGCLPKSSDCAYS